MLCSPTNIILNLFRMRWLIVVTEIWKVRSSKSIIKKILTNRIFLGIFSTFAPITTMKNLSPPLLLASSFGEHILNSINWFYFPSSNASSDWKAFTRFTICSCLPFVDAIQSALLNEKTNYKSFTKIVATSRPEIGETRKLNMHSCKMPFFSSPFSFYFLFKYRFSQRKSKTLN